MRQLRLQPRARADLDDIWNLAGEKGVLDKVPAYLTQLGAVFDLLVRRPDVARLRHELSPSVRIYCMPAHVIIYLADDWTVDVLRVTGRYRRWSEFLND